jgi:uncharacterized protein (TIGR02145 family)
MKKIILLSLALASVSVFYSQNSATADAGVIINDVRWATRNVDAPGTFARNPQDAGMFYQWNRQRGWAAAADVTDWDSSLSASAEWEAQNNPCPPGWRVPTRAELEALNRGSRWTTNWNNTGVNGRVFGSEPNQIFLPAAGWYRGGDGSLGSVNGSGHYWSSTPNESESAFALSFNSFAVGVGSFWRAHGSPIRCVAE